MINLSAHIDSSEKRFVKLVEAFFLNNYKEGYLISHGLDHHRRVWRYAKELLHHIYSRTGNADPGFTDKLLVTCLMHDIGMAKDPGEKHGIYSRILCEEFLLKENLEINDFRDVLLAIENHDNKEYTGSLFKNPLHRLLSVADDLDAFGCTGIWRYTEIYRLRGISFEKLGKEIPENAARRFEHFQSEFNQYPDLIESHIQRYQYLVSFFNDYNLQLLSYSFGSEHPYGYCGIIEIIPEIFGEKALIKSPSGNKSKFRNDKVIIHFFEQLGKELGYKF